MDHAYLPVGFSEIDEDRIFVKRQIVFPSEGFADCLRSQQVFSALGFYPVCPASDEYAAGSPLFKKATIRLENGKTVEIEAPENSPENRYVGKMRINGQVSQRPFIEYAEIEDGAKILFDMQVRK